MSDLSTSDHFMAFDALPVFDDNVPVHQLYADLHRRGSSGCIVASRDGVRRYLRGRDLAKVLVERGRGTGGGESRRSADPERLGAASTAAIGQILTLEWARPAVVTVPLDPVDVRAALEPLQSRPDTVFAVTVQGREIGWLLNHETVMESATGRTVFICENGHENPDSDHGTCYHCPGGFVDTRKG